MDRLIYTDLSGASQTVVIRRGTFTMQPTLLIADLARANKVMRHIQNRTSGGLNLLHYAQSNHLAINTRKR